MRDGSRVDDFDSIGFIAQELKELQEQYNAEALNLVYESNPDKLEATPGNLFPIVINAIKDLAGKVNRLEKKCGV